MRPLIYRPPSRTKDAAAFVAKALVLTVMLGIWIPIAVHEWVTARGGQPDYDSPTDWKLR